MRIFAALFAAALFSVAPAIADSPSVGVNIDVVAGGKQKQSSQKTTSLPTIAVPMFFANVPIKQFSIFAEGVPPIGPVSYADGRGTTQATKISYLMLEGRWHLPGDRFTIGAGTTLVNQATFYSRFDPVSEQSSRVAGFRISAQARVENTLNAATDISAAFSPSMHGLQHSYLRYATIVCPPPGPTLIHCRVITGADDSELASFVDLQASRAQRFGRYTLRYGLRYINYSAKYPDGIAADRERLIMPFVGMAYAIR
jgi:hypothetical protein